MGDSVKILGVTITNRCHITINVKFKKMVKNSIYKALNPPNQSNSQIKNRLIGLMYYSYMVDPLFFNYLQQKYSSQGKLTLTRIMETG